MKYEFKAQIDASKRGHHEKTAKQPKVIAAFLEEMKTQLKSTEHVTMVS
jgi:hypothetical protein